MSQFLDVCLMAARAGGKVLQDMSGQIHAREKAPRDLVTEADLASQETIRRMVEHRFPDHRFVGEESPLDGACPVPGAGVLDSRQSDAGQSDYCWIVDPLDGTLNYVHQLPNYCVSVALRRGDDVVVGAVYDPVRDSCFWAERGKGAWCDGQRIAPSLCSVFQEALIGASLPVNVSLESSEVDQFFQVIQHSHAIRRLGSAAMNLCYVAAGALDGYWATCAKIWDVAAGLLIVREAGGCVSRLDGTTFDLDRPQFVASATPLLHEQFLCVLRGGTAV